MRSEPVVYLTREIPDAGVQLLESACDVRVWDGKLPPEPDIISRRLSELDAEGLVCLLTDEIDAEIMDASDSLRVISTFSVGYDHIDLSAAADRDLAVGHTPGVLSETTADFAWALLMTAARRTVEGHEYVQADRWETWGPTLLTGPDIHDGTLGVVGFGNIGTEMAQRAAGFDMDVVYTDRGANPEAEARLAELGVDARHAELNDLLAESDFVSLHVPLTDGTEGLIDKAQLKAMRDDAILINTSRGPVIDTAALDTALENEWIERAALDVTDPEPLRAGHPLTRHAPEKLIVVPHIASASIGTRDQMARMAAENLLAGLEGDPLPNSAHTDHE